MRMLLLCISKLLKECLVWHLSDPSRVFSAMRYRSSQPKPFRAIRKAALKLLNYLLKITGEI